MSTRRARIKGITALPPRRKNADATDNKSKAASKDGTEKTTKSPRTPRVEKNEDKYSPRPPPALIPISTSPQTPIHQKTIEKVTVISNVAKSGVFLSPQQKQSPTRRIASPIVPSPRLKSTTPTIDDKINKAFDNIATKIVTKTDIEDYNVPSVPESITEDTVMDGIVPLQPTSIAPKPIDQLKNEIISENAEVLFDPIVPLPSPSKARPKKLRPVPRLAPHRRNSIQGSASESEDENRRALLSGGSVTPAPQRQRHDSHTSHSTILSVPPREVSRVRNDSICSSASQLASQPPPPATSPVKEKPVSKSRRQDMVRRMSAMRRRQENVQRDKLTMYDLIFFNPTTNPIVPNQDELNAKEANEKEAAKIKANTEEEPQDTPDPDPNAAPVPQIKLGPNGEIVLDEQSLVIKQTDSKRKLSAVVHEGSWSGSGGKYTRGPRTSEWSEAETVRFYRALAAIGTDFMLMAPLFPDRNRKDLYLKFKKEERINCAQVDKALRSVTRWDVSRLLEEFTTERAEAAQRAQSNANRMKEARRTEKERMMAAKELTVRQSRGSRALGASVMPTVEQDTGFVDKLVQRAIENRRPRPTRSKKRNEPSVDYATLTLKSAQAEGANKETEVCPTKDFNNRLNQMRPPSRPASIDMATITRVDPLGPNPDGISGVPPNIEAGSLVVLTVNDPKSPTKKMLQTYIARGPGQLTPVALPPTFLNSVVGYMKKGTPKSNVSAGSSPLLASPNSVASHDSRNSSTPNTIQLNPSPAKRKRHSSYNITPL